MSRHKKNMNKHDDKVLEQTPKSEIPVNHTRFTGDHTVPPHSWASHCMSHTSNTALWTQWIQPRCNTQLSQAPAPPALPPSENCKTETKPTNTHLSATNTLVGFKSKSEPWNRHKEAVQHHNKREDHVTEPIHQESLAIRTHQDNPAQTTQLQQKHTEIYERQKSKDRNIHEIPPGEIDTNMQRQTGSALGKQNGEMQKALT